MTTHSHTFSNPDMRGQVRRVLLITLLLNVLVAGGKIAVGAWSGALAIVADGLHSLMDGSSNIVALVANHIAARPPDDEHPYGHRRFETMAALLIGGLLLLTAWEIVQGAVERLQSDVRPEVTPVTFAVMLVTLAVNLFVSRYEAREGRRLRSELLTADAAHTRADVFVTLSVLASMVFVALGWAWVDAVVALVIVGFIGRAAVQVLRQTGRVLVDAAPYSPEELTAIAEGVPSVRRVTRARSRGPADAAHIDIDAEVAPETTADHTAAIAAAIRDRLTEQLGGVAEVEVHFTPGRTEAPNYALQARASADALGLSTHEVRVSEGPVGKVLEMHVEVPPGQTLDVAHRLVSQLEQHVGQKLPDVAEVITHIEPTPRDGGNGTANGEDYSGLREQALALLQAHYPEAEWHHLHIYAGDEGPVITMHATMPPQTTVEAAHRIAEAAETLLRTHLPQLERVTIHTEPFDHQE